MNILGIGIWIFLLISSGIIFKFKENDIKSEILLKIGIISLYSIAGILLLIDPGLAFNLMFRLLLAALGAIVLIKMFSIDPKDISFGQLKLKYLVLLFIFIGTFILAMLFGEHDKAYIDPRLYNDGYFYSGLISHAKGLESNLAYYIIAMGAMLVLWLIFLGISNYLKKHISSNIIREKEIRSDNIDDGSKEQIGGNLDE